ncbi:MAG: hypothetical protein ACWGQW_26145, partial [bacterium]
MTEYESGGEAMDVDVTTTWTREKFALPARGFTREALENLSAAHGEPTWMLEKRYKGWYHYGELETPFWRRTDLKKLHWQDLIPYAPPQAAVDDLNALPPKLRAALSVYGKRAGMLLQRDSSRVYLELAKEVRAQGVIWTDMHTAVREHPGLIRKYFMEEAVPAGSDKYTALHSAFWSGGT